MNRMNEVNTYEKTDHGQNALIEQSINKAGSAPTACVSPLLEGKNLSNHYIESLLLNSSQNMSQVINTHLAQNLGIGLNLGFGLNMNNMTGINELNSNFPLILPNQLYQVNNILGAVQTILPDCYTALPRGYNLNSTLIPQNILPASGVPITNIPTIESFLYNQSNLLPKEDSQSDINSIKLDSQPPIISPLLQPPLISSIGSQPSIIHPSVIPRMSQIISHCPGSIYQNQFINGSDQSDLSRNKKLMLPLKKEVNIPEESDKLNSLLNSYLNNIASLADAHERVKNYLSANGGFEKGTSITCDPTKLLGSAGVTDYNLGNVQLDRISISNLTNGVSQKKVNSSDQCIPGEPNDIFKISHTRRYRLGDQGRALLKSELSAYLRNHPEKRVEASKIADIRNATTKQLWQIAAMCGLEERFINLHAQSLAQSKGKVGLRGTKRKTNSNVNEQTKTSEQTNSGDFVLPVSKTESPELVPKTNTSIEISIVKSNELVKIPTLEGNLSNIKVSTQAESTEDNSKKNEGVIVGLDTVSEVNSKLNDIEDSNISTDCELKKIKIDISS